MKAKTGYAVLLVLIFAVPMTIVAKKLHPHPGLNQKGERLKKSAYLNETKGEITVEVLLTKYKWNSIPFFTAWIVVKNERNSGITVEQEKFFLVNKYDRELQRFSEDAQRNYWAEYRYSMARRPPPKTRRQYTIRRHVGDDYVVEETDNDWGAEIGTLIGNVFAVKEARRQIELLDKSHFRNGDISPGKEREGFIKFTSHYVADKEPFTVILFIEDEMFSFKFGKKLKKKK